MFLYAMNSKTASWSNVMDVRLFLRSTLLFLFVCTMSLWFANATFASDHCDLTRIAPTPSNTATLTPSSPSSLSILKGENVFLISCRLSENGVFTFNRHGFESALWMENNVKRHPIPAGDMAFVLQNTDGFISTAQITIQSSIEFIPRFTWHYENDYLTKAQRHSLIMGAFYGLGIALFTLSLVIGYKIGGHHLKRYSLYVFSLTAFFLLQEGQLFLFANERYTHLLNAAYLLSIGLTVFSATWFLSYFLFLHRDFSRVNNFIIAAAIIVFTLSALRTLIHQEVFWSTSGAIMGYCTLAIVALLFVFSIVQTYRGVPEAKFVMVALLFVLISMVFRILLHNYSPFMQRYGFILAFAVEVLVLAYALSKRISYISTEKERAERDASIDSLCGIANRRGLINSLPRFVNDTEFQPTIYAAFYIDIDDFKQINDCHGHAVGDSALVDVSRCLSNAMRSKDILCRLGGDEFIAIATFGTMSEVMNKHQQLKRTFKAVPFSVKGKKQYLSASVGCATFEHLPMSIDKLVAASDGSMYTEKVRRKSEQLTV